MLRSKNFEAERKHQEILRSIVEDASESVPPLSEQLYEGHPNRGVLCLDDSSTYSQQHPCYKYLRNLLNLREESHAVEYGQHQQLPQLAQLHLILRRQTKTPQLGPHLHGEQKARNEVELE